MSAPTLPMLNLSTQPTRLKPNHPSRSTASLRSPSTATLTSPKAKVCGTGSSLGKDAAQPALQTAPLPSSTSTPRISSPKRLRKTSGREHAPAKETTRSATAAPSSTLVIPDTDPSHPRKSSTPSIKVSGTECQDTNHTHTRASSGPKDQGTLSPSHPSSLSVGSSATGLTQSTRRSRPGRLNVPQSLPLPSDPTVGNKTESIYSDQAIAPLSKYRGPKPSKFSLEAYPSILQPVAYLRTLQGGERMDAMRGVSAVFSTCLRTVVHALDDLPYGVRMNTQYQLAQCGVNLLGLLFLSSTEKILSHKKKDVEILMASVLNLMDAAIFNLQFFLSTAEHLLIAAGDKPLPPIPPEEVPVSAMREVVEQVAEPAPLPNVLSVVLEEEDADTLTEDDASSLNAPTLAPLVKEELPSSGTWLSKKTTMIQRILQMTPSASKMSLAVSSAGTGSSLTLVDTPPPSPHSPPDSPVKPHFTSSPQLSKTKHHYNVRQSNFYMRADPDFPDVDVEMPLPTGDTVAIQLDSEGEYKAASLTAIIRLLTSKESVTDPTFTSMFFLCFRLFSTPTEILDRLIERFSEEPDPLFNAAQLRVWTVSAVSTRARVGKIIRTWLETYWRPELDQCALEVLQTFALQKLIGQIPECLATQILEGLNTVASAEDYRRVNRKKELELKERAALVPEPAGSGWELHLTAKNDFEFGLSQFAETTAGRDEFARQLTVMASSLYLKIDPEEVVRVWDDKTPDGPEMVRALIHCERMLCTWVMHNILEPAALEKRVWMIEFWLDIATILVRYRNFGSACAVYSGVVATPIDRMKNTLLKLSIHSKEQYQLLHVMFCGAKNYKMYREKFGESQMPAVPMFSVLKRDVVHAKSKPDSLPFQDGDDAGTSLINLSACSDLSKTVRAMEACFVPYKFSSRQFVQDWISMQLEKFPVAREEEFRIWGHEMSESYEPRNDVPAQLKGVDVWPLAATVDEAGNLLLHELPDPAVRRHPKKSKSIGSLLSFRRK